MCFIHQMKTKKKKMTNSIIYVQCISLIYGGVLSLWQLWCVIGDFELTCQGQGVNHCPLVFVREHLHNILIKFLLVRCLTICAEGIKTTSSKYSFKALVDIIRRTPLKISQEWTKTTFLKFEKLNRLIIKVNWRG